MAGLGMTREFQRCVDERPSGAAAHRNSPRSICPCCFDLPFIKLGKLFVSPDFMISLQHVPADCGINDDRITCGYRKLLHARCQLACHFDRDAFGTMLWPYGIYRIGNEANRSSYCWRVPGLANGKIRARSVRLMFVC
jgi:hypothetical protein